MMAYTEHSSLVAHDLQVEAAVVHAQRNGVVLVGAARRALARARHVGQAQGNVQLVEKKTTIVLHVTKSNSSYRLNGRLTYSS